MRFVYGMKIHQMGLRSRYEIIEYLTRLLFLELKGGVEVLISGYVQEIEELRYGTR